MKHAVRIHTDSGDKKESRRADYLDHEMKQLLIKAEFSFVFFPLFVFFDHFCLFFNFLF